MTGKAIAVVTGRNTGGCRGAGGQGTGGRAGSRRSDIASRMTGAAVVAMDLNQVALPGIGCWMACHTFVR